LVVWRVEDDRVGTIVPEGYLVELVRELASAFVARWCIGAKVRTAGGVLHVREDEPEPRSGQLTTERWRRHSAPSVSIDPVRGLGVDPFVGLLGHDTPRQ
jgi:hypothetical protein